MTGNDGHARRDWPASRPRTSPRTHNPKKGEGPQGTNPATLRKTQDMVNSLPIRPESQAATTIPIAVQPDSAALSTSEATVLAECEQLIGRGLKTFIEVGTAIKADQGRKAISSRLPKFR